jgi:hypothetical protein
VNQVRKNKNEHCGNYDEKRGKERRKIIKRRKRGELEDNVNGGLKKRRNMGNEHRKGIRIKGWRRAKENRNHETNEEKVGMRIKR